MDRVTDGLPGFPNFNLQLPIKKILPGVLGVARVVIALVVLQGGANRAWVVEALGSENGAGLRPPLA